MKSTKRHEKNARIFIILGTKAQLTKMAPIMLEFDKQKIPYKFIFTGQHKETINKLELDFKIRKPDFVLYKGKDITSILKMSFWACKIIIKALLNKRKIFGREKNRVILVHGDTFSTLIGAIIGKLAGLKVGHVEAGLRSFNYKNPFPEEIIRVMVFKMADYFFCPANWALKNLKPYKGIKINLNSNTLLDALNLAAMAKKSSKLSIPEEKYCVCSIHRFENIFNKNRLKDIVEKIKMISSDLKVVFILHLPTEKKLKEHNLFSELKNNKNIEIRKRYGYFDFIKLISSSEFLISDGGGNQEEASYLGLPVLLFRNTTERREGLGKNAFLSHMDEKKIKQFLKNIDKFKTNKAKIKKSPSLIVAEFLKKEFT